MDILFERELLNLFGFKIKPMGYKNNLLNICDEKNRIIGYIGLVKDEIVTCVNASNISFTYRRNINDPKLDIKADMVSKDHKKWKIAFGLGDDNRSPYINLVSNNEYQTMTVNDSKFSFSLNDRKNFYENTNVYFDEENISACTYEIKDEKDNYIALCMKNEQDGTDLSKLTKFAKFKKNIKNSHIFMSLQEVLKSYKTPLKAFNRFHKNLNNNYPIKGDLVEYLFLKADKNSELNLLKSEDISVSRNR